MNPRICSVNSDIRLFLSREDRLLYFHADSAQVEQLGPADGELRAGVVEFLPFSFEAVGHQSEKFIEVERRFAYTTPKSFLELIKLYTSMLGKKLQALEDKQYRLSNGLDKLKETAEQVAGKCGKNGGTGN